MARNHTEPVYIVHADLSLDLDMRDIPLMLCEAMNKHVHGRVACAQKRDGIWFIWVKSEEARHYLVNTVHSILINNTNTQIHGAYPVVQTRYPNEKIMFRDLPFDVPDAHIMDYLLSQPDIQVKTRQVIQARIRNSNGDLTPYYSGDRFVYVGGGIRRALPSFCEVGNYPCRVIHKTQVSSCTRCRYVGHTSTNITSCDAYCDQQDIYTIRSPQNILCNFYSCKVNIYNHDFHSSEQAYQWKFASHIGRDDLANEILLTQTPSKAKEIASRIPRHLHGNWHAIKLDVMYEILMAKLNSCPEFSRSLIKTGQSRLVEAVKADRFWSCGLNPRDATLTKPEYYPGINHLGRMLEFIRTNLLKMCEQKPTSVSSSSNTSPTTPPQPCEPTDSITAPTPPITTLPQNNTNSETSTESENIANPDQSTTTTASESTPPLDPEQPTIQETPVDIVSNSSRPEQSGTYVNASLPMQNGESIDGVSDNDFELLPRILMSTGHTSENTPKRSRTLIRKTQRFRSSSMVDSRDRSDMRPIDDYFAPLKRKASGNATSPTSELATKITRLSNEDIRKSLLVQNSDDTSDSEIPNVS